MLCYNITILIVYIVLITLGKSRKLSSLFKRSSKDDLQSGSGKSERSSGRGKRKLSKDSKISVSRDSSLDGLSSDVSDNILLSVSLVTFAKRLNNCLALGTSKVAWVCSIDFNSSPN